MLISTIVFKEAIEMLTRGKAERPGKRLLCLFLCIVMMAALLPAIPAAANGEWVGDATDATAALKIAGAVEKPGYFSIDGLKAYTEYSGTSTYGWLNSGGGSATTRTYRGIYLEDLLKEVMNLDPNAFRITISPSDAFPPVTLRLDNQKPQDEPPGAHSSDHLGNRIMLAWEYVGSNMSGLRLIVGQNDPTHVNTGLCLQNVASIVVEATESTPETSQYKHISHTGAPYNIDAITGATLTVEGPGVTATVPVTVDQLERSADNDIHRGNYTDQRGASRYEGVRLLSILDGAVHQNVVRLDDEVNIVFRNRWRHEIGRLSYAEIKNADSGASPIILAYGIADVGETWISPFVYDGGAGHNPQRGNGDGPLRLVYDQSTVWTGALSSMPASGVFSSVAYLYIEEGVPPPGFKHIAAGAPYDVPVNTEHIITLTGSALGREINFTTRDLQNMIVYGDNGRPVPGGVGYRDTYSLSNTTYWHVSEYEGVNLWELLVRSGVDRSKAADENTLVSFSSWDNYMISAQFSFAQLADPDRFMFYEKSPLDIGIDRPSKTQLSNTEYHPTNQGDDWTLDANGYPVKKGYPVLLAYGLNGYPYVRDPALDGYKSGLGNHGGPMRVIYGKTDGLNRANPDAQENYAYFFNNGSEQLQKVQEIYVGDALRYSTHKDNPLAVYQQMKSAPAALTVEIITEAGGAPQVRTFTLEQLQNIVYGVDKRTRDGDGRQEKGYYFSRTAGDSHIQELFEGVNLEYLLFEEIGMPGRLGTVELYNDENMLRATYDLSEIGNKGSSTGSGLRNHLGMVIAYAKNGYPMVRDGNASSPPESGYVHNDLVTGNGIRNNGGPLVFFRGQTDAEFLAGTDMRNFMVERLNRIVINLVPDEYAHVGQEHEQYAAQTINFTGAVAREGAITVGTLETLQRYIVTDLYAAGDAVRTYRGLDLLRLLSDISIGASSLMHEVTVKNASGGSVTITREQLTAAAASGKPIILAYGAATPPANSDAAPLRTADGGPMRLVVDGAAGLAAVTEVEVGAASLDRWTHSFGDYAQYADVKLEISGQNLVHNRTYTVAELQAMDALYVADTYRVGGHPAQWFQGVDLYKLLATDIGFVNGLESSPISVTADDGFGTSFTAGDLMYGVNGKPLLLGFGRGMTATDGLPLVPQDSSPGFDNIYGNSGGPIRLVIHDNSGLSIQRLIKVVVGPAGGNPDPRDAKDFNIHGLAGGSTGFTIAELRAFGEKTTSFTYFTGGATATPEVKGVYLYDLLKSIGVGDMATVTVRTLDIYNGPQYADIPMSVIRDNNYFVTYERDGLPISDTFGDTTATVRIYRNHNAGTNADNRIRNLASITVTDFDFTFFQTGKNNFPVAGVRSVSLDGAGGLWVGTYGGGIPYLPSGGANFTVFNSASTPALYNNFTSGLAVDAAGGVWFSQNASNDSEDGDYGVGYMKDGSITWYRAPNTVANDFVQAIEIDSAGKVWFGSAGGLTRYDPVTGLWRTWTTEQGLPATSVQTITVDSAGGVWVGFYPDTVGKQTLGGAEYDIFCGGYAHLNAAGEITFVKKYDARDETGQGLYGVLLGEFWVRSISIDRDGGVWVVRSSSFMPYVGGRVDYVSPDKQTVYTWTGYELLGASNLTGAREIRMVAADKNGGVWFGTSGAGVFHCTMDIAQPGAVPNRIHKVYSSETGAWNGDTPMDNIQYMRFFGDTLYAGSNGGIAWANVTLAPPPPPPAAPVVLDPPFTIRRGGSPDVEWGLGGGYPNNIISSTIRTDRKSYTVNGQTVDVRGALLKDVLAASGLSGDDLLFTITTTDGSSHSSYLDITLKEIIDSEYFLACDIWTGPGTGSADRVAVRDLDAYNVQASLRIYRNGSSPNEIRHISGLTVSVANTGGGDTDPGAAWIGSGTPGNALLTIEGAVALPGYLTLNDLQTMSGLTARTRTYTRLNAFGTRGQDTMTGVYLEEILKNIMKLPPEAQSIQITASDGYTAQYNLDTLAPLGIYSTDMNGNKIMLAWGGTATVDAGTLRLIVGQSNPDYVNTPNWIRNITHIKVNDFTVSDPGGSGNWSPDGQGTGITDPDTPLGDFAEDITVPVDANVTVSGGAVSANVSADMIAKAIEALDLEQEASAAPLKVLLNAATDQTTTRTSFTLSSEALELLAGYDRTSAEIVTDQGSMIFSAQLLGFLDGAGQGALVAEIEASSEATTGDLLAVSIAVKRGGATISEFGGAMLKADIPFTRSGSVSAESLVVYRVDEDGSRTLVKLAAYDTGNGSVRFGVRNLGSAYVIRSNPATFKDVRDHWGRSDIEFLASRGIVDGKAADTYDPQGRLTRAEFVKILAETFDGFVLPAGGATGFSDVPSGAWHAGYVRWAAELGIINGYEDGTFRPNANISRQEMAVLMARFINATGLSLRAVSGTSAYTDEARIGSYAITQVRMMQQLDIMAGSGGAFRPRDTASRAEAARVAKAFIDAVLR